MALPKSTAGDVANKKMKGLKDHKKVQKEKTLAKRTAAAEKAKVKKTLFVPVAIVAVKVMPMQEEVADNVEIAQVLETTAGPESHQGKLRSDSVIADESVTITAQNEPHTSIIEVEEAINEMMSEQPLNIVAHRKALEATLYDNMETPRQMLVRCKYTVSIDAEYYPVDEDNVAREADRSYNYELDKFQPTLKCLDDNHFEFTPIITSLPEVNMTARVDTALSLALLRLFGMDKDAGQAKAGIFSSSVPRAPESGEATECDEIVVNLPRAGGGLRGPVSMGHMSSTSGARVNEKPVEARTLESIEAEMRLTANNASLDPAIISYKIEGQALVVVDEHAQTASLSANNRSNDSDMLTLLLGVPIMSPRNLSPTSSHQSRTSSPVDPQRAYTPVTQYSASPPPELPVWYITFDLPSCVVPHSGGWYGPSVQMNLPTGGFYHQPLFPQYHAPIYTQ